MEPLTLEELKDKLADQFDEYTLVEMLDITSFQLVTMFSDKIERNYEFFLHQLDEVDWRDDDEAD